MLWCSWLVDIKGIQDVRNLLLWDLITRSKSGKVNLLLKPLSSSVASPWCCVDDTSPEHVIVSLAAGWLGPDVDRLYHHHTTTVLRPFRDHPGEPVPEENFWTLWCKGRLTEANTLTIRLGATPSALTIAHLHHPSFFTGRMPFLPPNQQHQSTEGN